MAENSKIEWTHHTFNPWRGCTKVSPGCAHCYADQQAKRNPGVLGIWGKDGARVIASENYWRQPLRWNAEAIAAGEHRRVFCASMADVFEGDESMPPVYVGLVRAARRRLFKLIQATPGLDWLLLTKRPENILPQVEQAALDCSRPDDFCDWLNAWLRGTPPTNVWLGTSVENQEAADQRIPHLLKCPAVVRFLSCEPLIDRVELDRIYEIPDWISPFSSDKHKEPRIHWVIAGGESGGCARPMHPDWPRGLRDQCQTAGVSFFFKQWGEWLPYDIDAQPPFWSCAADGHVIDGHGLPENISDGEPVDGWLADLEPGRHPAIYHRVGKHAAGRFLDGRLWNEFPQLGGSKAEQREGAVPHRR